LYNKAHPDGRFRPLVNSQSPGGPAHRFAWVDRVVVSRFDGFRGAERPLSFKKEDCDVSR
jgi:hypothetical protein